MSVESETCRPGRLLQQDLARAPLVGGVHVRVDEADRDRLDLARTQLPRHGAHGVVVERRHDGAGVVDRSSISSRWRRRISGSRRVPEDVVELLAVRPPDLEDVAEALAS